MSDERSRILAVAIDRQLFHAITPLLDRSALLVERVPRGGSAIALCQHVAFDMMIVSYPLPDMALDQFLAQVRQPNSASERAPLVVLAVEEHLREIAPKTLRASDVVLSITDPVKLVDEVVCRLLKVPPRSAARLLVRVEVALDEGKQLVMCQTENLSEVGMLLRTDRPYPVGTRLSFEFSLPGDRASVKGLAVVMRQTSAEVESVRGVGVKFDELRGDDLKKLREFLKTQVPPS